MVWYYAEGDRQRGPISDEEFQEMVNRGRIHSETLVWKDGMENWQSLSTVGDAGLVKVNPASLPATDNDSPGVPAGLTNSSTQISGSCSQCGRKIVEKTDSVKLGNILLCKNCDADMARHYQQSASTPNPWATPSTNAGSELGIQTPAGVLPFASILSRFVAKIIDNMLETVVMLIIMVLTTDISVLIEAFESFVTDPDKSMVALRPFLIGSLVFSVLYNSVLVALFGATLGKMVMGIKVVSSDGSRVGSSSAIIRAVTPAILQIPAAMIPKSIVANFTQGLFLFGFLMAFFDLERRTLYDRLAGTRVVID